jgi:hypothetical protein
MSPTLIANVLEAIFGTSDLVSSCYSKAGFWNAP